MCRGVVGLKFRAFGLEALASIHHAYACSVLLSSKGFPMGAWYGPLASLKGSELWRSPN